MFENEKKEALDLIEKFYGQTASTNRSYAWNIAIHKGGKSFETARQCALICWDKILEYQFNNTEYITVEHSLRHDRIRNIIETYIPQ